MSAAALAAALVLLTVPAARAGPRWLTLGTDSRRNLTLLELAPGSRYLLRPTCTVLSARVSDSCDIAAALSLRLRLWTDADLRQARSALRASERCGPNSTCLVSPLPVQAAAVRDRAGLWQFRAWRNASGRLPPSLLFVVRQQRQSAAGGQQRCAENRTRPLTTPEQSELDRLAVHFLANVTPAAPLPAWNISLTFLDVVRAARRLNVKISRTGVNVINSNDFARLTASVLREKLGPLVSGEQRSQLKIDRAVLQRTQEMITLIRGVDSRAKQPFFVLKPSAQMGRVSVTVPRPAELTQLNVSVPLDLSRLANNGSSISLRHRVIERLQRRVFRLETANWKSHRRWSEINKALSAVTSENRAMNKSLDALTTENRAMNKSLDALTTENRAMNKSLDALTTENRAIKKSLEAITAQLRALARTAGAANGSEKGCAEVSAANRRIDAVNRTVSALIGQLDVDVDSALEHPTLVRIRDCAEVKRRRLAAGVFFLSTGRQPVLCTADGGLVVLRRAAGDISFDRSRPEYESGFGDPRRGDFFVGLRLLAALTANGDSCAALSLVPMGESKPLTAQYSNFFVSGGEDGHRMTYANFKGSVHRDSLLSGRGRAFTTKDSDNDDFPLNCAHLYATGGWYSRCGDARVFGPPANSTRPQRGVACWRGLRSGGRSSECAPLSAVTMVLRRAADGPSRRHAVHEIIAPCDRWGCRSRLQQIVIERTGLYSITAAGGAGGPAWHFSAKSLRQAGGRGALVRARFVLRAGTKLGVVVGCGGGRNPRKSFLSGYGGNATIVADRSRGALLLMAGGGGGASWVLPGLAGRAVQSGGNTWWSWCGKSTPRHVLQRKRPDYRGLGWADVRRRVLGGATAGTVTTGEMPPGAWWTGGCGGGYNGCQSEKENHHHAAGGGGGSFCDAAVADGCHAEEGGNFLETGFLLIERHACF